jgi:hypothetical protein
MKKKGNFDSTGEIPSGISHLPRVVYHNSMRLFLTLLLVVPLCAQEAAPKQARPAPKNLKVLKVPPTDIRATMQSFRLALGVQCDFCHVKGDFASDENPKKDIARKMIVLAQDVNAKFPDGKEHVTCYTCHRGDQEPKTTPPAP